jgi:hypothetical protein
LSFAAREHMYRQAQLQIIGKFYRKGSPCIAADRPTFDGGRGTPGASGARGGAAWRGAGAAGGPPKPKKSRIAGWRD